MKDTFWTDFTAMAFAEPLTVISETASPSMWLFEPLMTTVLVPAGISTCVLDSSIVKVPAASDLPESLEVSDLPESLDASVLVSVLGLLEASGADEAAGAEESPPDTLAVWEQPVRATVATARAAAAGRRDFRDMVSPFR